MNLTQRFTLLVQGSLNSLFDSLEDPERSLDQLVIEMEEQLEAAKRAAAGAMAGEERLRGRIARAEKDAADWREAARRAVSKEREEDAREALRRAERERRQVERLREQLASQETDTAEVRESVRRLQEQLAGARQRLELLRVRMRQSEARRAVGCALRGAERLDVHGEFDRLSMRVEQRAGEEAAYLRLDSELGGHDLRRRFEEAELDDAVDDKLAELRAELAEDDAAP